MSKGLKLKAAARALALAAVLVLPGACAAPGEAYNETFGDPDATVERFEVCHGYGCLFKTTVAMSTGGWEDVTSRLRPAATSPAQERVQIAQAIARMEQIVGAATGTDDDKAEAALFAEDDYQLDCIDETVNTTTYLKLLAAEGLLTHHEVGAAVGRGAMIDGRWPHNSAVIVERQSGQRYVVDSWFHENGVAPEIVPVEVWLAGWSPGDG